MKSAAPLETRLASRWVTETGDEKRHTDSAQYRGRVTSEELRLRTLLEKVRRLA